MLLIGKFGFDLSFLFSPFLTQWRLYLINYFLNNLIHFKAIFIYMYIYLMHNNPVPYDIWILCYNVSFVINCFSI